MIVQLSGSGAEPDEISEYLPNRSPLSCRRRYLELHAAWSEELQNKTASVIAVDGLRQIEAGQAPDAVSLASTTVGRRLDSSETHDTRTRKSGTTTQLVEESLNPIANFSERGISPSGSRAANTATWTLASDSRRSIPWNNPGNQADSDDSETSDHSWFDDIVFSGACRFPAVELVAVSRLLDAYHAWSKPFTTCHTTCAAMELAEAPEGSPPDNTPSSASNGSIPPPSSEASSSTALTSQGASKKGGTTRKRGWDDDDEPEKPRAQKRKRVEDGKPLLACPFYKRYSPKHYFCKKGGTIRGFRTIAQVKQHIRESHIRFPIHCPRCKVNFDDNQKLGEHIVQAMETKPCEERPFLDETMLPWSKSLVDSIRARVDVSFPLPEQWYSVWRLLFPGIDQPASCWVEEEVCRHVIDIRRFAVAKGGGIVCISLTAKRQGTMG